MRILFCVALVLVVSINSTTIHAESDTIANFYKLYDQLDADGKRLFRAPIGWAGHAYDWANLDLKEDGKEPIYCKPKNVSITTKQYFSILRLYVETLEEYQNEPKETMVFALLLALKNTFSCPK